MVGCLLIGLIWIVLFYLMGNTGKIPVMNRLGQWNLALGMAVIATSFAFATKWELSTAVIHSVDNYNHVIRLAN